MNTDEPTVITRSDTTESRREGAPNTSITPERRELLFHATLRRNLPQIWRHGIRPIGGEYRSHLAEDLTTTALENGIDFPIDRQACVFFYPELSGAAQSVELAAEAKANGFGNDPEAIAVVDRTRIDGELFVGDFDIFSDIIDFQFMNTPDSTMVTDSYEDALYRYLETLTPITPNTDMRALCAQFHRPEVLIKDGVRPDAIVEVRSLKRIQGSPTSGSTQRNQCSEDSRA